MNIYNIDPDSEINVKEYLKTLGHDSCHWMFGENIKIIIN